MWSVHRSYYTLFKPETEKYLVNQFMKFGLCIEAYNPLYHPCITPSPALQQMDQSA